MLNLPPSGRGPAPVRLPGLSVLLSRGMKEVGHTVTASVLPYIEAMANPWVASGIFLLICWLVSELTLLSWADLSYVLPVTRFHTCSQPLSGSSRCTNPSHSSAG